MYIYIYTYIGVRDFPLRDMISLGAWRMGLGCSAKFFRRRRRRLRAPERREKREYIYIYIYIN